jgi:hypothetical protein
VDQSADLPTRRALFFPVVIATVLLSIIGMSAGLVLSSRHTTGSDAAPPVAPADTTSPSAAPACRSETQEMGRQTGATGTLRIELVLRTVSSTVWICSDEAGRLYYHANRGGADARWVENKTALFLTGVRRDGDGYAVTAPDGTRFSINARRLYIVHKDGRPETQRAVD